MTEASDPATELYKLCTGLKSYDHKGHTHQALAAVLGVEEQSSEYFETMGHLASRFGRLATLYENLLEGSARTLGVATIRHLQQVLAANRQLLSWRDTKSQIFDETRLSTLQMSAPFIRIRAPLTIPTKDEIKDAITRIDDAIETLANYHGAISAAFLSSLYSIKRVIERLDIYGIDAFTDEFLRAYSIRTAADREADVPAPERKARSSAWAAITMFAGLLVAPDAVLTAVENHYSRSEQLVRVLIQETKLLPAPATENQGGERKAIAPGERTRRRNNRSDP